MSLKQEHPVARRAVCDLRCSISRVERRARHDNRENVEKSRDLSVAFQRFVADQKKMSPGEFRDMQAGYQRMQEAAEPRVSTSSGQFWPDLKKAAEKRAERKVAAEKEANKGTWRTRPYKNPRSDPAKGGAKPRVGKKGETGNVVQLQPPSGCSSKGTPEGQGDAVLNGLTPGDGGAERGAQSRWQAEEPKPDRRRENGSREAELTKGDSSPIATPPA